MEVESTLPTLKLIVSEQSTLEKSSDEMHEDIGVRK
jgi:hypothetical protein